MKILHLWRSDSNILGGGGAESMLRVHNNLRKNGIDSKILCEFKTTNSKHISTIPKLNRFEKKLRTLSKRMGLNDIHRFNSFRIRQDTYYKNADIIHFHGTHSGFLNYLAIPYLAFDKPAIFTLRDMWCLTGHCGYSYDCERWQNGCGKCPYPQEHPSIQKDSTRLELKLKKKVFEHSNLAFVAMSHWMRKLLPKSIIHGHKCFYIPNGVDSDQYRPIDAEKARTALKIPIKKYVILFTALRLNDPRKGRDLFLKALECLPARLIDKSAILSYGAVDETPSNIKAGIETYNLGYVDSAKLKILANSAADVFVFPTRAENFPNAILESMACRTPVVSFDIGGIPDLVKQDITGHLAKPGDSQDLSEGILKILENESLRNEMANNCRHFVKEEFSTELETNRHIEMYEKILLN